MIFKSGKLRIEERNSYCFHTRKKIAFWAEDSEMQQSARHYQTEYFLEIKFSGFKERECQTRKCFFYVLWTYHSWMAGKWRVVKSFWMISELYQYSRYTVGRKRRFRSFKMNKGLQMPSSTRTTPFSVFLAEIALWPSRGIRRNIGFPSQIKPHYVQRGAEGTLTP